VSPDAYKRQFGDGGAQRVSAEAPVPLPAITRGSEFWETFTGQGAGSMPAMTEGTALMVSAIYACVNLIAGVMSALPMHLYNEAAEGERTQIFGDPLWWVLNEEFSPRWPASAGWERMVFSRLLHGDAFAEIVRSGPRIVGLKPLHPLLVQPVPVRDVMGERLVYVVTPEAWEKDHTQRVIDQADMIHVAGLGYDGIRSMSPLRYALRMAGGVASAAQHFSGQFFSNSARPDFALTTDKKLEEPQIENLRNQVEERHGGANRFRPMVLQGGLDIKTISLPNSDMELIATRKFQIEEIARIYGVPPWMIGHTEKTTSFGNGISEMGSGFKRYALGSHLVAFRNEINRKFFRVAGKLADFDTFELESADMKSLFEAFRISAGRAGEPGFMTTDEIRTRLKLKKLPGGDQLNKGTPNAQPPAQPA
jgi:HK97 family phage portal protein